MRIVIKKSPTADTRTAQEIVSKETLLASSKQHIEDVQQALAWVIREIEGIAIKHDYTKIKNIDEFHADFADTQIRKANFTEMKWYKDIHLIKERHHVDKKYPDDVDLLDLLEHIADIVVAGMARSGKLYEEKLSPELLEKAYQNTVKKIKEAVEVI